MANLLEVSNLHTYFFLKEGVLKAVSGVDLTVRRKQIIGIVGESACGKSTFGFSILRLVKRPGRIVEGEIKFLEQDLLKKSEKEMQAIRGNKISMIFQDPMTFLNPSSKIGHQISESILLHKKQLSRKKAVAESIEMLKAMGIPSAPERATAYPHQLSGGMCQRVMIAMALCCEPDLLIADEPTTALDVTIQAQILELIKQIKESRGASIILITHDLGIVARMCDYVGIMYAGKMVEYADVNTIFSTPKHPYTIGLLNSMPKISLMKEKLLNSHHGHRQQSRLHTIPGQPPDLLKMNLAQCSYLPRCARAMRECAEMEPGIRHIHFEHWFKCFL